AGLPKLFPSLTAIVIAVPCPLLVRVLCWSTFGVIVAHRGKFRAWNVRFSNRPVGVKRFQAVHDGGGRCRSRARASLRNRHIGPSIMGSEDGAEQSNGRPCR